jgi:hypothetical protein
MYCTERVNIFHNDAHLLLAPSLGQVYIVQTGQ